MKRPRRRKRRVPGLVVAGAGDRIDLTMEGAGRATFWATVLTIGLAVLIVLGSRNLEHFDAALVGYTFATLFATFGITYRYAMWLQRPPTRMYWRRGWRAFLSPRRLLGNLGRFVKRGVVDVAGNRFIFRRGALRGLAHWLLMWGCLLGAAITFPLVWGWIHFETVPGDLTTYRTFVFGFAAGDFPVESWLAFVVFHGLVWASFLVLGGVMLAFRRRLIDHGARAVQQFGEDILPLVLLGAIAVTGLMITVSYTWLRGYAYDFLAILHAVVVIVTLLWLPFGKFFHIFQRPAQLGVAFYQDAGAAGEQALCARCQRPYASAAMVRDLITVERQLGFRYELASATKPATSPTSTGTGTTAPAITAAITPAATHYQQICPACRRALFGLAQSAAWYEVP
jgi:hypothetical protein